MKIFIFLISSAFCYFQFNGNNTASNYSNNEDIEYQDEDSGLSLPDDNEEELATSEWETYDKNDADPQAMTDNEEELATSEWETYDQNDADPQAMTDDEEVQDQSDYTPDNNPVTWDEDSDNYPTERPTTYNNVDDIEVQSPTHYNAPPPGACAVCGDGTYSFSRNRRGTCSRHGGVSRWLR